VLGHLSIPRNYLRYGTRLTGFKTSQKLGRPRDVSGMAADVKSLHAARHLPRRLRTLARHAHHLAAGRARDRGQSAPARGVGLSAPRRALGNRFSEPPRICDKTRNRPAHRAMSLCGRFSGLGDLDDACRLRARATAVNRRCPTSNRRNAAGASRTRAQHRASGALRRCLARPLGGAQMTARPHSAGPPAG
jgi:hypothetical protein